MGKSQPNNHLKTKTKIYYSSIYKKRKLWYHIWDLGLYI